MPDETTAGKSPGPPRTPTRGLRHEASYRAPVLPRHRTADATHEKGPVADPSSQPREGALAQPSCGAHTRFLLQPVRPSSQSQSLSQSYGSGLPTSLTYIVLLARGCSPWRPAADMGTVRHKNHIAPTDFQGTAEVHRTPQEPRCFTGTTSISRGKPIPWSPSLTKKRKLFPGLPPTVSVFVCVTATGVAAGPEGPVRRHRLLCPGSGILT